MTEGDVVREMTLAEVQEDGEWRKVSLVAAGDLSVIERSSGPVTEAAYGSLSHGHKVLCSRKACAHTLGVVEQDVEEGLARFFGTGEEVAQLSDLMDLLDMGGERYTYLAWTGQGDGVMRSGAWS